MWAVGTPWATCQSPWIWLLPSMHWAAPGSPVDVPKLPLQPWAILHLALASAPHLFHKGSHLRPGDSPPVQAHSCGFALHGASPPSIKLTLTLAWPASPSRVPTGKQGTGWGGADTRGGAGGHGGRARPGGGRQHPSPAHCTVLPHRRLFVFITNSIFKTRPAAAELSGSPFLCLQRSPPPLAPPLTNPAILMENSLVSPSPSHVPRQLRA